MGFGWVLDGVNVVFPENLVSSSPSCPDLQRFRKILINHVERQEHCEEFVSAT